MKIYCTTARVGPGQIGIRIKGGPFQEVFLTRNHISALCASLEGTAEALDEEDPEQPGWKPRTVVVGDVLGEDLYGPPPTCCAQPRQRPKSTKARSLATAVRQAQRVDLTVQPSGHAISGHPRAVSVLVRRDDWPWLDDFAPLDAPNLLPQGSHDVFTGTVDGTPYIGFTVTRDGTY